MPSESISPLNIDLPDEAATAAFAEDVAACLQSGGVIALSGDLGAGKTTFARGLIRALADDAFLEVPSPTFTLVQTYATLRLTVAHFDLYRISSEDELDEIGLADAALDGVVLVEWPDRAGDRLPPDRLDIALAIEGTGRRATISGGTSIVARINRSRAARFLLDGSGWEGASRRHLQGDASSRRYERIHADDRTAVLMDWPPLGQLAAGDPRGAFRARDVRAFIAVATALENAGLSSPEIYAADMDTGLLLLEDFGDTGIVEDAEAVVERYRVAIEALAHIHQARRPTELPLPDGSMHRLPRLTGDALLGEIGIFADFYVPFVPRAPLAPDARNELIAIWRNLDRILTTHEQSWVLFDVQSPNLFWLPERDDIARIGFIDFQDMFVGPSAYDVASLCQDARVSIPPDMEDSLTAHYVALRRAADAAFDVDSFRAAYAICAALRIAKTLGAFSRFASVKNTRYISHLPRLRGYLGRALSHPVLQPFALWYERYLPSEIRDAR